ncbi:MAG: Fe2+-dependent dioxygenase [Alphaproteobacteria bacterium]|nr:Fe2+-dependent dioxygenase [Alphaproteobacteria bacterium]MBV9693276.1 Fe2+-dependent dioxygenase [Alphaproteobacteria bacterium]
MMINIPNVLTAEELKLCRDKLAAATWTDGRATAGARGALVKRNLQLAEDSAEATEMAQIVLRALQRNQLVIATAFPHSITRPNFSRYEPGMTYGFHSDAAIMPMPRTPRTIRADVAGTLFLSEPGEYDGGELQIEDGSGMAKLPAGHLVLYPANTTHRVAPITRGARHVSFFWIQSIVRNETHRRILFDIDRSLAELNPALPDHPALSRISAVYHNCLRLWGEV